MAAKRRIKIMPKINLQFENVFKITTMAMRMNGSHPAITRNRRWIIKITILFIFITSSAFMLNYSLLVHDIPNRKYADASKNGIMVIVWFTITLKFSTLLYYQKSIKSLTGVIDVDYKLAEQFSEEERKFILKYSQKGVRVCKLWLVCAVVPSLVFPLKAFVLMFYYYLQGDFKVVPMFEMTCPPIIEQYKYFPPVFSALFLHNMIFGCIAAIVYIGFDPLILIYMLHTCGQLELLSQRIGKSFSEVDNPRIIEEKLKAIISKYQQLCRFVEEVQNNFRVINEYNMKVSTFLLPLTAFQVAEDLRRARLNIEFISFFAGSILHFFMPCYYSDLLMETSENFRQAIYSCGWEKVPDIRVRKMVLLMMTRAMVPLGLTTIFYPVCLDTFAEMCRQSYAMFNLMNAAWA